MQSPAPQILDGPDQRLDTSALGVPLSASHRTVTAALGSLGLNRAVRILEFDVETAAVAQSLAEKGYNNYLGLARDIDRLADLRATAPESASHFHLMQWPNILEQLTRHNADVMILSGEAASYLRYATSRRHVTSILWRPGTLAQRVKAGTWYLYKRVRGALGPLKTVTLTSSLGPDVNLWAVQRTRVEPLATHRRYISPEGGLPSLFEQLNEASIHYVVLRWFEDLPHQNPGEDIDLLVADEDWPELARILDARPGVIPCDVYTCSGLPGTDWNGVPYYPPHVAEEIIRGRVPYYDRFYVPCTEHHLFSLAYHAAYHKGRESGLSTGQQEASGLRKEPDHPYAEVIASLGKQVGLDIDPTLPSLHSMLHERGWTPETDTLRKLSLNNRWLERLLPSNAQDPHAGELIVFVIREWAAAHTLIPEITRRLENGGLRIIEVKLLDGVEQQVASRRLRGGKWGAAEPGQLSAGGPAALIVAFDPAPRQLTPREKAKYPHVWNGNVLLKHRLREEMNAGVPVEERTNFIHSADDEIEAWEYLRMVCPGIVEEVREKVTQLRGALWPR